MDKDDGDDIEEFLLIEIFATWPFIEFLFKINSNPPFQTLSTTIVLQKNSTSAKMVYSLSPNMCFMPLLTLSLHPLPVISTPVLQFFKVQLRSSLWSSMISPSSEILYVL